MKSSILGWAAASFGPITGLPLAFFFFFLLFFFFFLSSIITGGFGFVDGDLFKVAFVSFFCISILSPTFVDVISGTNDSLTVLKLDPPLCLNGFGSGCFGIVLEGFPLEKEGGKDSDGGCGSSKNSLEFEGPWALSPKGRLEDGSFGITSKLAVEVLNSGTFSLAFFFFFLTIPFGTGIFWALSSLLLWTWLPGSTFLEFFGRSILPGSWMEAPFRPM